MNARTHRAPIGILAGAPRPNAAKLFIDFCLSKEGKQLLNSEIFGVYSLRPDLLPSLDQPSIIGARPILPANLDDRIGLSEEEKRRKAQTPPSPLPAKEPLLADRLEHVFPRRDSDKLTPDNPWGFKIDMPEHLYNRGELYNLCIGRGTLTAEDRFKINEHMIETIKMLSRLPFPAHLANVAEIAGGHHEKMDGTGYPCRLSRDQMSVPARMMAIADIFEALTAVDRPYKKGKTISESLTIMARMRDEQHIDPELFELFVCGGVYREFAERFLQPEQIDEIEPGDYVPGIRDHLALSA